MTFPSQEAESTSGEKWVEIIQRIAGLSQILDALSSEVEEMILAMDTPEAEQIRVDAIEVLKSIQLRR